MKNNKGGQRTALTWVLVIVVGVGLVGPGLSVLFVPEPEEQRASVQATSFEGRVPCIQPNQSQPEELHIHPVLRIIINGAAVPITPDVGLTFACELVIHTHDSSGIIHIEPNNTQTLTLGDFFAVWGKPFNRSQTLDHRADAEHEIVMTVNGEPSQEFERLALQDKQEIVIEYRKLGI